MDKRPARKRGAEPQLEKSPAMNDSRANDPTGVRLALHVIGNPLAGIIGREPPYPLAFLEPPIFRREPADA